MKIDHPFKNIIQNETSHICGHYEITNMVNMGENRVILKGFFLNIKLKATVEFILKVL